MSVVGKVYSISRQFTGSRTHSETTMTDNTHEARAQNGFSLIELIVSITIMSVGVLGYASSSVVLERQISIAALESDRTSALVTALERARSIDFDTLDSAVDSVAGYHIDRTVTSMGPYVKEVYVIASGPGFAAAASGGVSVTNAADTFTYQVVKP